MSAEPVSITYRDDGTVEVSGVGVLVVIGEHHGYELAAYLDGVPGPVAEDWAPTLGAAVERATELVRQTP